MLQLFEHLHLCRAAMLRCPFENIPFESNMRSIYFETAAVLGYFIRNLMCISDVMCNFTCFFPRILQFAPVAAGWLVRGSSGPGD